MVVLNNEARIELEKLGPVQEYEHRGVRYYITKNGAGFIHWVCGYLERTPFVDEYIFEEQWPPFSGWTYKSDYVVGFDYASHQEVTVDMVKTIIVEMINEAYRLEYKDKRKSDHKTKVKIEHWRHKENGKNLVIHTTPHYVFNYNFDEHKITGTMEVVDVIFDGKDRGILQVKDYNVNIPKAFDLVKTYYVTGKKDKDDE